MSVLRLEVENDYPGLTQLLLNPTGEGGGFGWITPVAQTRLEGLLESGNWRILVQTPVAATATYFQSEKMPIVAGQFAGASWIAEAVGGTFTGVVTAPPAATGNERYRMRFDWYDAAGTVTGSTYTGYLAFAAGVRYTAKAAEAAPAGTETFRIRIDLYSTAAGAVPAARQTYRFRDFAVAVGATAGAVTAVPSIPHPGWTNILGPVHNIRTERTPLGTNFLAAEILDTTLDPATSASLRPGHKLRLRALESGTGTWRNVFPPADIDNAKVDYDLRAKPGKQVRISVLALDAGATLANTTVTGAVGVNSSLPAVLEGAGVPWRIWPTFAATAPTTGHAGGSVVSIYPWPDINIVTSIWATLSLSQPLHAFIDRDGVCVAGAYAAPTWAPAEIGPFVPTLAISDADFSDIKIGFDTADVVNQLEINWHDTGSSGTTTAENVASKRKWRARKLTVDYIGPATSALSGARSFLLKQHADPVTRPRSLRIPITTPAKITERLALAELCHSRRVDWAAKSVAYDARLMGINHTITPDGWLMDVVVAGVGDHPVVTNE